MWGVLVLASLVGLFLGLAVSALVQNWAAAAAVLLPCFVVMIALGGWFWPLPRMNSPLQTGLPRPCRRGGRSRDCSCSRPASTQPDARIATGDWEPG